MCTEDRLSQVSYLGSGQDKTVSPVVLRSCTNTFTRSLFLSFDWKDYNSLKGFVEEDSLGMGRMESLCKLNCPRCPSLLAWHLAQGILCTHGSCWLFTSCLPLVLKHFSFPSVDTLSLGGLLALSCLCLFLMSPHCPLFFRLPSFQPSLSPLPSLMTFHSFWNF